MPAHGIFVENRSRRLIESGEVAAMAVAPPDAVRALTAVADEVVCLHSPEDVHSVGQFFNDFRQVEDDDVVREPAAARNSS
jgi:predicted phosphoribosyltransferase